MRGGSGNRTIENPPVDEISVIIGPNVWGNVLRETLGLPTPSSWETFPLKRLWTTRTPASSPSSYYTFSSLFFSFLFLSCLFSLISPFLLLSKTSRSSTFFFLVVTLWHTHTHTHTNIYQATLSGPARRNVSRDSVITAFRNVTRGTLRLSNSQCSLFLSIAPSSFISLFLYFSLFIYLSLPLFRDRARLASSGERKGSRTAHEPRSNIGPRQSREALMLIFTLFPSPTPALFMSISLSFLLRYS